MATNQWVRDGALMTAGTGAYRMSIQRCRMSGYVRFKVERTEPERPPVLLVSGSCNTPEEARRRAERAALRLAATAADRVRVTAAGTHV